MGKLELTAYLIDKASKGITAIFNKGRQIAGKVWSVTISVIDKITTPIRGMISKIGDLVGIAGIASAALGGLTVKNALEASATQKRYETQFATVAGNVGISKEGQSDILKHAADLQNETMYSNVHHTAVAGELATYISDPEAIKKLMGTVSASLSCFFCSSGSAPFLICRRTSSALSRASARDISG